MLGCLPPQKATVGEERMLPSEVAKRMIVADDMGFALFLDQNEDFAVSYILEGSVAAKYEKFKPGDVVREIDGVVVKNMTVSKVEELLTGEPGSTLAMLVTRHEAVALLESNLVIMARPSASPSQSPLRKARASMRHPDVSFMSDASMTVHPSLQNSPQNIHLLDTLGKDALESKTQKRSMFYRHWNERNASQLTSEVAKLIEDHVAASRCVESPGGPAVSPDGTAMISKTARHMPWTPHGDAPIKHRPSIGPEARTSRSTSPRHKQLDADSEGDEPMQWDTLDL